MRRRRRRRFGKWNLLPLLVYFQSLEICPSADGYLSASCADRLRRTPRDKDIEATIRARLGARLAAARLIRCNRPFSLFLLAARFRALLLGMRPKLERRRSRWWAVVSCPPPALSVTLGAWAYVDIRLRLFSSYDDFSPARDSVVKAESRAVQWTLTVASRKFYDGLNSISIELTTI